MNDVIDKLFKDLDDVLNSIVDGDPRKIAIAKTDAEKLKLWIKYCGETTAAVETETIELVSESIKFECSSKYPYGSICTKVDYKGKRYFIECSVTEFLRTAVIRQLQDLVKQDYPEYSFVIK